MIVPSRIRNREIRERYGSNRSMLTLVDQIILKLFGHIKKMDDGRHIKRVYRMGSKEWDRVMGRGNGEDKTCSIRGMRNQSN